MKTMTNTDYIYGWLKELGHKIAEHAAPIRHVGGDHSYDGAIEIVWDGVHEALGIDPEDCMTSSTNNHCPLHYSQQGDNLEYSGEPTQGGPVPDQHPDDAFRDGYDWAQVIDTVYDENAHTNKIQDAILDMIINRANEDRELTQAILEAYRKAQED